MRELANLREAMKAARARVKAEHRYARNLDDTEREDLLEEVDSHLLLAEGSIGAALGYAEEL